MGNFFIQKIDLVNKLKSYFNYNGFCELLTPVLRQSTGEIVNRVPAETFGYLRDSHELQLRYALSAYESIYEIGSCFRYENIDSKTNMTEFILAELFTSKHTLDELSSYLKDFIRQVKDDAIFGELSIAKYIKDKYDIDLFVQPQELLYDVLHKIYVDGKFNYDFEYVNYFIGEEIEPLSKGKFLFLKDYPECTCSYAKIIGGENSSVINRIELFFDGLEIANGFDDECDCERFIKRNEIPIFQNEEVIIAEALKQGILPLNSSGLGIGIERLCMAVYGIKDINQTKFISDKF